MDVLYRAPVKPGFKDYFDNSLKQSNISLIPECYLISDFNVNLLSGNKILLEKLKHICFPHSLYQLIVEPTRITKRTITTIDHILMNSPEKLI